MAIKYPKFRCNAVIPAPVLRNSFAMEGGNAGIQGFQYITGFPDEPGSSTGSEFIPLYCSGASLRPVEDSDSSENDMFSCRVNNIRI